MFLIMFLLIGMGLIYPLGAFMVWSIKYRKSVPLKEFWKGV